VALSVQRPEHRRGRPTWGALGVVVLALAGCGAQPAAPREVPWKLLSDEGRTLRLEVQAGGPPCDKVIGVDVDEGPNMVVITVRAGSDPDAQCGPGVPAILGRFTVDAKLRAPLGTRSLRDGAR
jgi:hypothetical protein